MMHRTLSHIHEPPALCFRLDLVELGDPSAAQHINQHEYEATHHTTPRHKEDQEDRDHDSCAEEGGPAPLTLPARPLRTEPDGAR